MLGDYFTVITSHSTLFKYPLTYQNSNQNKPSILFLRFLGFLLFFLIVILHASPAFSARLSFGWNYNSESGFEGHGVYFKKNAPESPFDLSEYVPLQELSDPDIPTFTMSGLQKGPEYYIALFACDTTANKAIYLIPYKIKSRSKSYPVRVQPSVLGLPTRVKEAAHLFLTTYAHQDEFAILLYWDWRNGGGIPGFLVLYDSSRYCIYTPSR